MSAPPIPDPTPPLTWGGPYSWTGVLVIALITAVAWAVLERYRWLKEREETHDWRTSYWHLLATARCPLCGTRAEPETAPPVEQEPSRKELG